MSHWLVALIILVAFMLARGLAMTYLAVRVRRAHALMHRYWSDEAAYEAIGYRKSDIVRLLRGAQVTAPRVPRAQPIGVLAHLPSDVLVYIGVSPESAATRASTVIGWSAPVLGAVAVVASAVSR
jgi:hypothetical protein